MGFGKYRTLANRALDLAQWGKQVRSARIIHGQAENNDIKLSVVVPFRNAERWIGAAINSIQAQNVDEIEIITIDDKSSDRSRLIVQALAKLDQRIMILNGQGLGPGAARNLGIEKARGCYLTFADADDIVLPHAYRKMLSVLQDTGSDFICGGYLRHKGLNSTRPKVVDRVHRREFLKADSSTFPEIFDEPVLWNKIYRTDFWRQSVGQIPTDVNYEDQPAVLRAIVQADSFDVLKEDVYSWRLSEDGTSRSGTMSKVKDIQDREKVISLMWEYAQNHSLPKNLCEQMLVTWLDRNLMMYVTQLPSKRSTDEYYVIAKRLTEKVWEWAQDFPNVIERLSFTSRVAVWTLINRGYEELLNVLAIDENLSGDYYFDRESLSLGKDCLPRIHFLPEALLRVKVGDLKLRSQVLKVVWESSQRARLTCVVFLQGAIQSQISNLKVFAVDSKGNRQELRLSIHNSDLADSIVKNAWDTASEVTFEVSLSHENEYLFEVQAQWGGWTYVANLESGKSVASRTHGPTAKQGRFLVGHARGANGSEVRLKWHAQTGLGGTEKTGSCGDLEKSVGISKDIRLQLASRLSRSNGCGDLLKGNVRNLNLFNLILGKPNTQVISTDSQIAIARWLASRQHSLPRVETLTLESGSSVLQSWAFRVVLDGVLEDGGYFVFRGRKTNRSPKFHIWLVSSNSATKLHTVWAEDRFEARVRVSELRAHQYFLRWSILSKNRLTRNSVGPGDLVSDTFSAGTVRSIRVEPRSNGTILVEVLPALTVAAATRWEKRPIEKTRQIKPAVYFESFSGKTSHDNPGAICRWLAERHPNLNLVMGIRDETVEVPNGIDRVIVGSNEWFEAIRSASVLVTNDNFPHWFRKDSRQFWLQTWHGTPIKRLLLDANPKFIGLSYRKLLVAQATEWDLLLAQNEVGAERIAGSVKYQGEILVGECPRNLRLFEALAEAGAIKERLGVPREKKVILWAPTWRNGTYNLDFPAREISQLDGCILLVRGHHMRTLSVRGKNIINVSSYPSIEELLAITDVLISDYSSIFFDFARLNRKAIIYAPDLERYRDEERGFYGNWPNDSGFELFTEPQDLLAFLKTPHMGGDYKKQSCEAQDEIRKGLESLERFILARSQSKLDSEPLQ